MPRPGRIHAEVVYDNGPATKRSALQVQDATQEVDNEYLPVEELSDRDGKTAVLDGPRMRRRPRAQRKGVNMTSDLRGCGYL